VLRGQGSLARWESQPGADPGLPSQALSCVCQRGPGYGLWESGNVAKH
jgi:hypothetical protein